MIKMSLNKVSSSGSKWVIQRLSDIFDVNENLPLNRKRNLSKHPKYQILNPNTKQVVGCLDYLQKFNTIGIVEA